MTSAWVGKIVRAIIGVAVLWWLLSSIDLRQVVAALQRCSPIWLAAGAAAFAAATLVAVFRLQAVFRPLHVPFAWAVRLTLASYFFHQLLPTGLGGDAYRSLRLKNVSGNWTSAIGLLLFERAAGSLALILPAFVYAVSHYGVGRVYGEIANAIPSSPPAVWVVVLAILVVIAIGATVLARRSVRLRQLWTDAITVFRQLSLTTMSSVFALSVMNHALRIMGTAAFLSAVGYRIAVGDLMVVMALTLLASLVPVSIGALGVREGIFVYGLALFGVPHPEGLTVALLNRMIVIVLGLLGAFAFYGDRSSRD